MDGVHRHPVRRVLPLVALTACRTLEVGARCGVPRSVVQEGSPERQRRQKAAANAALHLIAPLRVVAAHKSLGPGRPISDSRALSLPSPASDVAGAYHLR
jgi:hypothetical protein